MIGSAHTNAVLTLYSLKMLRTQAPFHEEGAARTALQQAIEHQQAVVTGLRALQERFADET